MSNEPDQTTGKPSEGAPPLDWKSIERELQLVLDNYKRKRTDKLSEDKMLLVAAVPTWTASLADYLHDVAVTPDDFKKLAVDGFMDAIESPLPVEQTRELTRFVMPDPVRAEVFERHILNPEFYGHALESVSRMGQLMNGLGPEFTMPEDTRRWAGLARFSNDLPRLVDELDERLRDAVDSATIHRLLSAAQSLMPILGPQGELAISLAMQRGSRRLELLRRKDDDLAHLRNFILRNDQMFVLERFLATDDRHWALHIVGAGGVGKTMLLRYLTSQFPSSSLAVTRIDFDYLNPDFPRLAPGLLLWAIGQDFRAYTRGAITAFDEADQILKKLHEELRARITFDSTPTVEHPRFKEAIALYIAAIKSLHLTALVILDTCEELARIRPDGTVPDNVRDTFRILEMLHDGLPELRVIFSGRRSLACQGDGWTCPTAEKLPPRPFLQLHEIRGFTHAEARVYLEKAMVPENLREAIIQRCPDVGSVIDVKWTEPAKAPAEVARCNPYDLKLYAEWAAEEPHPAPEAISQSNADQYVEHRILRRLHHPELESLLPVISVLGHIDETLLRELTTVDEFQFEKLQLTLRQQEWTNVRRVSGPEASEARRIYTVDPALRQRLNEYGRKRHAQWVQLRDRALRLLERTTIEKDLSALDWTDFDAALNGFEDAGVPERPARWWCLVEHRLLARHDPQWACDLLAHLVNKPVIETANGKTKFSNKDRIRPAMVAAYAAALDRCSQGPALQSDLWEEVWRTWDRHPLKLVAVRLRFRAAAGRLKTVEVRIDTLSGKMEEFLQVLRETRITDLDPETAAVGVGAVANLLETVEGMPLSDPILKGSLVEYAIVAANELSYRVSRNYNEKWSLNSVGENTVRGRILVTLAACLRARSRLLMPTRDREKSEFSETLSCLGQLTDESLTWLYWPAPESILESVLLEYARAADCGFEDPGQALKNLDRFFPARRPDKSFSVDRERIESLRFRLQLRNHPPEQQLLSELRWALSVNPVLGATAAQRSVAPVSCVAAEELAAAGCLDEAVHALRHRLENTGAYHEEVRQELERTCLRISRRFRLYEGGFTGAESLLHSRRMADRVLIGGILAMSGQGSPIQPDRCPEVLAQAKKTSGRADNLAELLHLAWRTQLVSPDPRLRPLLEDWHAVLRDSPQLWLDRIECEQLIDGGILRGVNRNREWMMHIEKAIREGDPLTTLRLRLRSTALLPELGEASDVILELATFLGLRKSAEIALEEADFLGLRLPGPAIFLARCAERWFRECGDSLGSFRASLTEAVLLGPKKCRDTGIIEHLRKDFKNLGLSESDTPQASYLRSLIRRYLLVCSDVAVTLPELYGQADLTRFPEYRLWFGFELKIDGEKSPSPRTTNWRMLGVMTLAGIITALELPWAGIQLAALKAAISNLDSDSISSYLGEFLAVACVAFVVAAPWLWRQWFLPRLLRILLKLFCSIVVGLMSFIAASIIIISLVESGPEPGELFIAVCISFVLIGLIIWRIYNSFRVWRFTRKPLRIVISESEIAGADNATASQGRYGQFTFSNLAPVINPRGLPADRNGMVLFEAAPPAFDKSYQDFARATMPPLLPLFKRMRKLLGLRRAVIEIDCPLSAGQDRPWEALCLLNAGSKARSTRAVPFQIRRTINAHGVRLKQYVKTDAVELQTKLWHGASSGDHLLAATWQGFAQIKLEILTSAGRPESMVESEKEGGINLLHIVGTVQEDSSGLRLRLNNSRSPHGQGTAADLILRAEEVVERFSHIDVCILQGEPFPTATEERSVYRRRASLARAFAARLVAMGVRAVVTVPSLQEDLAAVVVKSVADYASAAVKTSHKTFRILNCVDDVRHLITMAAWRTGRMNAADLIDPVGVARRLSDPQDIAAFYLAEQFTAAGRRSLAERGKLSREALVGLLLDEFNPLLRRTHLATLPKIRQSLGWWRWLLLARSSVSRRNRAILSRIFLRQISDGKATVRAEAWENALDVCAFCADNSDARFTAVSMNEDITRAA
jgi:hypothetical protein